MKGIDRALLAIASVSISTCCCVIYIANRAINIAPGPGLPSSLRKPSSASRRRSRADGCYHVFIDVGANIGVHTRFLFEPSKYPESKSAVAHFENVFGAERDNRDICSFAFEPNPAHKARHLELQSVYKKMEWRYHPIFAGVSDVRGNMTFYHMHDGSSMEFGFNSLRTWNQRGMQGEAEVVPIIRLAEFLDEIRDRRIPRSFGKYDKPKVVMKMDAEGMEYIILPDLVTSGALCSTVDFCFGEFHPQEFYLPQNHRQTHGGLYLANATEGKEFGLSLVRAMTSSRHCKTPYSMADDESYLKDKEVFILPNGRVVEGDPIPYPEPET